MRASALLLVFGLLLPACGSQVIEADQVAVLAFDMDWSDPEPFNSAWRAARDNPALGVRFTFPVVADGIDAGAEARLYVGRSTTDGSALETGNDVILVDQHQVSTATIDARGAADFGPLAVTKGSWTSGTNTIHYSYLCGTTIIAARAFRRATGAVPGSQFVAAAWFHAVAEPCE